MHYQPRHWRFYLTLTLAGMLAYAAFITLLPQKLYLQLVPRNAAVTMSIRQDGDTHGRMESISVRRERDKTVRRKSFHYFLTVRRVVDGRIKAEVTAPIEAAEFNRVWNLAL